MRHEIITKTGRKLEPLIASLHVTAISVTCLIRTQLKPVLICVPLARLQLLKFPASSNLLKFWNHSPGIRRAGISRKPTSSWNHQRYQETRIAMRTMLHHHPSTADMLRYVEGFGNSLNMGSETSNYRTYTIRGPLWFERLNIERDAGPPNAHGKNWNQYYPSTALAPIRWALTNHISGRVAWI